MDKPIMATSPKEVEVKKALDGITDEYLAKMVKLKEKVIFDKLKEINKLNILRDFEKKRFKKLMIVQKSNKEEVWIDNGTINGKLLVTFVKSTEMELKDEQFKWQLKYY
jgi:hypothetical protein